jgi:hypothetical protein
MVHEIARGKRNWEDARRISQESTVAYNLGREAPYAECLLFEVPTEGMEDLDESAVSGAILRQTGGKIKDVIAGHEGEATNRVTGGRGKRQNGLVDDQCVALGLPPLSGLRLILL